MLETLKHLQPKDIQVSGADCWSLHCQSLNFKFLYLCFIDKETEAQRLSTLAKVT